MVKLPEKQDTHKWLISSFEQLHFAFWICLGFRDSYLEFSIET